MIQTKLVSGATTTVTFLPTDKRVKVGTILSLQGDTRRWRVTEQWTKIDASLIHRDWHVGGL
jgi:hypothetical protein